jgi:hypothetical protein
VSLLRGGLRPFSRFPLQSYPLDRAPGLRAREVFHSDCQRASEPIQRLLRRDDWSEEELGVPDNEDRSMLINEWREERRRQELPSP